MILVCSLLVTLCSLLHLIELVDKRLFGDKSMVLLFSSKYQLRSKTISKVNVEFDLFSHGQMDRDRQINV